MARTSPDYDNPWKEILEEYFPDFMAFYFPDTHQEIDWNRGYEFLDNELRQIARDARVGKRYVDKLARVWRPEGKEEWVLVHVEIQASRDSEFAERMYVYNNRIYDKYRKHVASVAVLADSSASWRPRRFAYSLWGCNVSLEFPTVKLIDWKDQLKNPDLRKNIFGVVTIAHLRTLETQGNNSGRLRWKIILVKSLYDAGYSKKQILDLFRFIDWIMMLPSSLKQIFYADMEKFEQEKNMPYISSVEKIGLERGLKQGMQQGMQQGLYDALVETLTVRFSSIPQNIIQTLQQLHSAEKLRDLHRKALTVGTLAEFAEHLKKSYDGNL